LARLERNSWGFGDHKLKLYVHSMNNKITIYILLVLTGSLFVTLAYYRDAIGMLIIGSVFIFSLMALKSIKHHE
jgi:hypothetical protein